MTVTTSLKSLCQDVKDSNAEAGKCLCKKGLVVHWNTALAQELPTNYLEKLTAYQCHMINLHCVFDYLIGQIGNADKNPSLF
jgi:hypothetical protein